MKMYTVAKETKGIAVNRSTGSTKNILTTRELNFTKTITDPIAYRNGRYVTVRSGMDPVLCDMVNDFAEAGYSVFFDEENGTPWMLVVDNKFVA